MRILGILFMLLSSAYAHDIYQTTVLTSHGQTKIATDAYDKMLHVMTTDKKPMPSHRDVGLQSTALRIGQQYGYADQLQYLQKKLQAVEAALNQIYI